MKILISRISPDVVGGAELSAFDQAVALKELGHTPLFVTNLPALRTRAQAEGIKTAWMPWINRGPIKPLRIAFFFLALPFLYLWAPLLALWFRPDVINPHSREDQNIFTFTKWLHGRPVVWKDAGDLRTHFAPGNDSLLRRRSQKEQIQALQQADYVYFLNEADRVNAAGVTGEWLEEKSTAIPASILYRYYDRSAERHAPDNKLIVGTLGRLEQNKGLQYLIEAVKHSGCSDDVEYWLVGDGAYKPELRLMASSYPCIKFKPYTDNVSEYLNVFDILVHPAEIEGWGRIIKEGMYFGLPIIGSNVGGIALQIRHNKTGLLFEVGNASELAKHLEKLLDDKHLRRKLGDNARFKAEKDGDFLKIVEQEILPIYKQFSNSSASSTTK